MVNFALKGGEMFITLTSVIIYKMTCSHFNTSQYEHKRYGQLAERAGALAARSAGGATATKNNREEGANGVRKDCEFWEKRRVSMHR